MRPIEQARIDRENLFLLYATFCGDVVKTAAAVGLRPVDVLRIVDECGWVERLKPIIELNKSAKPGDVERAINRALNFTQAHRMRMFLERVVARVCDMTPEELEDYLLTGITKSGDKVAKLSTRALADLSSALEKVHALTYQALGDTAPERQRRTDSGGSASSSDLHLKIAEAMSAARAQGTLQAQLADAQIAQAQEVIEHKPESPLDDEEH